jgi:S4 domain protein YaaA
MKKVRIVTEYITLGQFLKFVNLIGNGGEVKEYLSRNMIIVNGEEENRRGRKLYSKDQVIVGNEKYEIVDI